ncbi:MAG: phage holin family protein [Chloroflexi bacterium]|nr:phage holin family protein [Chloroflexota bacterium]
MYREPGYRTLIGRLRDNARAYVRKQLELPRQEIAEIIQANLRAVKWFAIAAGLAFMVLIALVVLLVALIAIVLPLWLAALVVLLLCAGGAALAAYTGYKRLELRGPTRSIESVKETVRWVKSRLLGRSAS